MNETLKWLGDNVAWLIGLPLIAFMATYKLGSPWRADPLGIERMAKTFALFLLWLLIMAGNFLPDQFDTVRYVIRIFVFLFVTLILVLQVVNLRRIQTNSTRPLFFTWLTYKAVAERRRKRSLKK